MRHAKTGQYVQLQCDRTPGRNRNSRREATCCGPPVGRRPARATHRVAEAVPCSPPHSVEFGLARYFVLSLSPPPAESSNEPRRVAARRVGWRRTARLYESQKQYPIHRPILRSSSSGAPPAPAYGVHCAPRTAIPLGIALFTLHPKALPRVRLTAAPLSLRRISVARGNSCRIGRVPTGRICPLKRAGDRALRGIELFRAPAQFIYIRLPPK